MKNKTKKILSRIGAGLLLGLSFLNIGIGWGKQKPKSIPRRAQNIRKQTREDIDIEVKQVVDVAEQEAQSIIQQENIQQQQLQLQSQQRTNWQQFIRYGVVGGWGIAMTIFFTSMIFNYPLAMGKAVLSLLPGNPHLGTIALIPEQKKWLVGEKGVVDIKLTTHQDKVNYIKLKLKYNPQILKFNNLEVVKGEIDILQKNKIDEKKGLMEIVLEKGDSGKIFNKEIIAKLNFISLEPTSLARIILQQQNSLILRKNKNKKDVNILGKVVSAKFKIFKKQISQMNCQFLDIVPSRMNRQEWERIIKTAPLPGNNFYWQIIDNKKNQAVRCVYSNNGIYLLAMSEKDKIKTLSLVNKISGQKINNTKEEAWQEGNINFKAINIDSNYLIKEKPGKFRNVLIKIKFESGMIVQWPNGGLGEFILIKK